MIRIECSLHLAQPAEDGPVSRLQARQALACGNFDITATIQLHAQLYLNLRTLARGRLLP